MATDAVSINSFTAHEPSISQRQSSEDKRTGNVCYAIKVMYNTICVKKLLTIKNPHLFQCKTCAAYCVKFLKTFSWEICIEDGFFLLNWMKNCK